MAYGAHDDRTYRLLSAALDADFYVGVYRNRLDPGMDPLAHFIGVGWRDGLDPAPWFSTSDYLATHEDVAMAGVNPLEHYLQRGRLEGREISRSRQARRYYAEIAGGDAPEAWTFDAGRRPQPAVRRAAPAQAIKAVPLAQNDREAVAGEFDATYYLALYPDVAQAGVDPLDHYLGFGWKEGRDPNARYSTTEYLTLNPDVAAAGVNPFVHYVRTGRAEGRKTRENLGFRHDVIAKLIPVEDRLAACDRALHAVESDAPSRLASALNDIREGLSDLHITFSHDNYAANLGGVQLCLQREARAARAQGRAHLHLFPAAARPMLLHDRQSAMWGVLLNGALLGFFTPGDVIDALGAALATVKPGERSFAIHSLLGHHVEDVIDLLQTVGLRTGHMWTHDFTSVCAGIHLLRNDVADCGAPPPDSPACRICIYGPYRQGHVDAHRRLFEALSLTVVSPSQAAQDTWRLGPAYPAAAALVHPLARLTPRAVQAAGAPTDGPFRFGYLGLPVAHKGWPIFRDLAIKHSDDPRYAFVHLGKAPIPGVPASFQEVSVDAEDPLAMQAAIENAGLDAVLLWSLCRETFSFTAYESAAAGAAVLTGPDSGNIAAFVESGGYGRVLADEAALFAAFESGEVLDLARSRRRPQLHDLSFSSLTLDLMTEPV